MSDLKVYARWAARVAARGLATIFAIPFFALVIIGLPFALVGCVFEAVADKLGSTQEVT